MDLDNFFSPKSVAVIGASATPGKIGNSIFKNLLHRFSGKVYPVNPNAEKVEGRESFNSVLDIKGDVDCAIVAIPAKYNPEAVQECAKKGIKNVILVAGGFREVGRMDLEEKIKDIADKSRMRLVGPNCLGTFDTSSGMDTMFLAGDRLGRPKKGNISFISQSGAVGSVILDWLSDEGIGLSKFCSYGNALDVNETDLIEYMEEDKSTEVIACYIEGIKAGRRFIDVAKNSKTPIIILKSGKTQEGSKAISSHTGSLAGEHEVYQGVFNQTGVIEAETWEDLFDYSKAFSMQPIAKGDRVAIITDGGGFGILATDEAQKQKLKLPEPSAALKHKFSFPDHVITHNPIDLTGDATAERYSKAVEECVKSPEYDGVIVILLTQIPTLDNDKVVKMLSSLNKRYDKPIICCSAGGEYAQKLNRELESKGIPVYDTPERAVEAFSSMVKYSKRNK